MTKQNWLKATAKVQGEDSFLVQQAFIKAAAIGIEIKDGVKVEINAFFKSNVHKENVEKAFTNFVKNFGLSFIPLAFSMQSEENWQENFIKSLDVIKVDPDIFIVPSSKINEFQKENQQGLFLEMNPENAFGTGSHETTKLALTLIYKSLMKLPELKRRTARVLDAGCGSGILSILIKKLHVDIVDAVDIDEDALKTAKNNAQLNNVDINFTLHNDRSSYLKNAYDLVVANIIAPVLINLKKDLTRALKPGCEIILSGILLNQYEEVIRAYEQEGLYFVSKLKMGDWCALKMCKK